MTSIPDALDWRQYGIVTSVKNQRSCGSCWSFSTTGAVESHWALKNGNPPPILSEQQLIDCAQDFNNFGCKGGLPSQAFEYIFYNGGLESEKDYPYMAATRNCTFDASKVSAKLEGQYNITFQDENELLYKLANEGPISIAYQVNNDFFQYRSGVYSSPSCSQQPSDVNHAVLAVGYGVSISGQLYYIVKNSWGPEWGINGYFLIERGTNMCGLADCASYPIVQKKQQEN
ncbi:papain family cysteine protease, putative [Ichthyophthirius multifiliis]|uniref:Papain family cysteine protease, putative n=1 Tax=Ichthyophthirius multifiliis TaxID=5932 RepID=G0QSX6_ICHMU|nr:papain family cysteine protease, putative [Ichthyophthirius multifiliis]EGR31675.1 papain family cysteine protease, putative [Ichthyophthirius multifiliis]|eukprot:XP_004035161.1 papain family cysteine protease, putative [Ichthyophthirius multifiliis]